MPPPPALPTAPPPEAAGTARVTSRVVIRDKILFDAGKFNLRPKFAASIKTVTTILTKFPNIKKVRIEGHSDDPGPERANVQLSEKRALTVKSELMKAGIDPGRLDAVGLGRSKPASTSKAAKAREANRRVEFTIVEQ
jgi:outer membrane protein OmpA-like peptidoglycan-associated protein